MARFDGGEPYGACALGVQEYAACFGFCVQGHDVLDRVENYVYGCIVNCVGMFGRFVAEDVPGDGAGTCVW